MAKYINLSVTILLWSVFSTVGVSVADDTEIYVTSNSAVSPEKQPNVLMILDSSGSMGDKVSGPAYDPIKTYPGSADDTSLYLYSKGLDTYYHPIPPIRNACTSVNSYFESDLGKQEPVYKDLFSVYRFRNGVWGWIYALNSYYSENYYTVECMGDSSTETGDYPRKGEFASDNKKYGLKNQLINWKGNNSEGNAYAREYALVSAKYHSYLQWRKTQPREMKATIMKRTAKDLVEDFEGLNVALMRFYSSYGGYVLSPFLDISDDDNKAVLKSAIDIIPASGNTPLGESMEEAGHYYRGDPVKYGRSNSDYRSVATSRNNGSNYVTPIIDSCQKNYIVLLTDGMPTADAESDSYLSIQNGGNINPDNNCKSKNNASSADDTCLDEAAKWLYQNDHSTSALGNNLAGKQNIVTYTIGFDVQSAAQLLQDTAEAGGGKSYAASSASELSGVFEDIFQRIVSSSGTFAAPSVTVNSFNRLRHRESMYYAAFKPKETDNWQGNVKKFTITSSGQILDKDNAVAIDGTTGQFKESSKSLWVADDGDADGVDVVAGGFVDQMPVHRKVYTSIGSALELTAGTNQVNTANSEVTEELLGVDSAEKRAAVLDWANTQFAADPLHTTPMIISYGDSEGSPDDVVYTTTNLGFLHALNGETGEEYYGYIPADLLPNLTRYYDQKPLGPEAKNKTYGLDGPISAWVDNQSDGINAATDRVNLYLSMRRGGRNYYALDVTDKTSPKLKWTIKGGEGDFDNLGQTWSTAKKAKIKWVCNSGSVTSETHVDSATSECYKNVLIFSGGYDTRHDSATAVRNDDNDDVGAAIYMVDADTGARLWMAGYDVVDAGLSLSEMKSSIVADVSIIDFGADGYVNLAYAVDVLGKVWRFDFNSSPTSDMKDLATGGVIADLGGSFTKEGETQLRRFYYAPDISFQGPYLAITLGSGYRAHPLDTTVDDRFYTLFDKNVGRVPSDGDDTTANDYNYVDNYASIITEDKLEDVSVAAFGIVTEAEVSAAVDIYASAAQVAVAARKEANEKQSIVDTANEEHAEDSTKPAATAEQITAAENSAQVASEKEAVADEKQQLIPREIEGTTASYIGGDQYGWYMDLPARGEKVLAETTIYGGNIYFTTYIPPVLGSDSCSPSIGFGRLYARNITSGETGYEDGVSFIELASAGIPSAAAIIYTKDTTGSGGDEKTTTKPIVCVGTECKDIISQSPLQRSYWKEGTREQRSNDEDE